MLAKTPVTQRIPCYSAVSALLINPLPDCSNYSPLCHTHYLTPDQYFTSLFRPDPLPSHELEIILQSSLLQRFTAESSWELSVLRKLNNKQRQVSMFLILLFKLLTQFPFVCLLSILSLLPFSIFSLLPLYRPPKIKTSSFIRQFYKMGGLIGPPLQIVVLSLSLFSIIISLLPFSNLSHLPFLISPASLHPFLLF